MARQTISHYTSCCFNASKDTLQQLKVLSKQEHISISAFLRGLVRREYLSRQKKENRMLEKDQELITQLLDSVA
jgi:hypothetical protein